MLKSVAMKTEAGEVDVTPQLTATITTDVPVGGAHAGGASRARSRGEFEASTAWKIMELPPPPTPVPDPLIALHDVYIGHPTVAADAALLKNVTLAVRPGMRLFLCGCMASGKSTLLDALSGRLQPLAGRRVTGRWLQTLHWDSSARNGHGLEDETPANFVQRLGCGDESEALSLLNGVGIDQWAARRPCGCLSSGERTLLSLTALAAAPKHLLLLDEPTIFLGEAAIEALAAALAPERWPGALVFASSSRRMCELLQPTHVARLHRGALQIFQRAPCDDDFALAGKKEEEKDDDDPPGAQPSEEDDERDADAQQSHELLSTVVDEDAARASDSHGHEHLKKRARTEGL